MSIETTHYVNRQDAIDMLRQVGIEEPEKLNNEELGTQLYFASRELDEERYRFENYLVVDWTYDEPPTYLDEQLGEGHNAWRCDWH